MERKIIILIFTIILLSHQALAMSCDENEIENCKICGEGDNSGRCETCDDKYFLVLNGEKCVACDDEYLGQIGCDGNCELRKSERNIFCHKCKEDYYYEIDEGTCAPCSFLFDNCLKCSYLSNPEENGQKVFKCLECVEPYILYEDQCVICDPNCEKCQSESFCEICKENYVKHPDGYCEFTNSYSCLKEEYSDDETPIKICKECKEGYFMNTYTNECYSCYYRLHINGCEECRFTNENELICTKAEEYIEYIDTNGEHIKSYCEQIIDNCNKCSFHSEDDISDINNLICDECRGNRYYSNIEKKCKDCKIMNDGCIICSDDETSEENVKCNKYDEGYYIYSNGTSIKCSDYFQEGCIACSVSPYDLSLYCSECSKGFILDYDGKCKHCENDLELIGCEQCEIYGDYRHKCNKCKENYILFEGKCVEKLEGFSEFNNCEKIENIGNSEEIIFSCVFCKYSEADYIFAVKENGAKICVDPSQYPQIQKCDLSKEENIDGENDYTCISCYYNYRPEKEKLELIFDNSLKKYICKCKEGYYEDDSSDYHDSMCKECNRKINYCKKCHINNNQEVFCDECQDGYILKDYECVQISNNFCKELSLADDETNGECIQFKEPYFLNKTTSKIEFCFDYLNNCSKCSYINSESSDLKCDKCLDNYFLNQIGNCEHCYINKEESLNCISCTDNEELKKSAPCQKCYDNYFLTKENKCVYCKSEEYGGRDCKSCGYITVNGIENIGCIECDYDFYGYKVLTDYGECFNRRNVAYCSIFGYYFNTNNEKKYGCIECESGYILDDQHA